MGNKKEMTPLSASRIKTAQSCNFKFWNSYFTDLPNTGNPGSSKGSVVHELFEMLGNPRHKHRYDELMEKGSIFEVPVIERYIKKLADRFGWGVNSDSEMAFMDVMIMNSLRYDFFGHKYSSDKVKAPDQSFSELKFDITKDDPERGIRYRIRGMIDKLFLFDDLNMAIIRDFKSSKKVFTGKEIDDNIQDLMYSLVSREYFPEHYNRRSEFLFLQFTMDDEDREGSDGIVLMDVISDEELDGFELYLTGVQNYIDDFDEEMSKQDYAKDRGLPKDGSFSKKLLCAPFCKFKGQHKKNGDVMWHCPERFPFEYLTLQDPNGKVITSAHTTDCASLLKMAEDNEEFSIIKKKHEGCPAWRNIDRKYE